MRQFSIAVQQTGMTSDIYRYILCANFKNQELIKNLFEREEKDWKIIEFHYNFKPIFIEVGKK